MRAFIAFKLSETIIDSLRKLQTGLKDTGLNLRWVRVENIHLTLKFLGSITEEDAQRVGSALRVAAKLHPMLSLTARGLGVFPTVKKARVVWTGIHGDVEGVKNLHRAIDQALGSLGFEKETRPFRGHLTLGRIKGRIDGKKLASAITEFGAYSSPSFVADRLVLFKSDLKPSGAVYTEILAANLKAGDI